ncbi:MAG: sulfotransferase [Phycisphaerales bacterium JB039]
MAPAPILIFGVPRSGTTLLRALLNAHPAIAAGPEAPWLAEHQPRSLLGATRYLAEDPLGWCANFGGTREEVFSAARAMLDSLMGAYAARRGKRRWAHKTPNDILHAETLLELLPDARVIWLVRDGLDVAMSTAVTAEHRRGIAPLYEQQLKLAEGVMAPSAPLMALVRWGLWNHRVRRALGRRERLVVRYESLVRDPRAALEAVCGFLEEPFDPAMLDYAARQQDLPGWEWGSADVRAHGAIRAERAGRAARELPEIQARALAPLAAPLFLGPAPDGEAPGPDAIDELVRMHDAVAGALGARPGADRPGARAALEAATGALPDQPFAANADTLAPLLAAARGALVRGQMPAPVATAVATAGIDPAPAPPAGPKLRLASLAETRSLRFRGFMDELNAFARPLHLREMTSWSKIWEYPWIWFHALAHTDWRGKRVVDLGSEISPMPWKLATLGAEVLLVETDPQWVEIWERTRAALGVNVRWSIVESERIEAPDGWADCLTSFSVIEHQPDKRKAIDEAARVLKPGGVFALSFDICEPSLGMTFPEWNGRALTMAEFEREIWNHPAFASERPPAWNVRDIPGFLGWHRTTAPHHNYVAGAATLIRR